MNRDRQATVPKKVIAVSKLWAVARHTIAAGIRMKVALFFILLIGLIVLGLPFVLKGDGSLAGAIQSYLTYALLLVGLLLSLQTILMSWTLSEELVQRQILVLMTKPVARWQYITGKWLGIILLDLMLLTGAGVGVYGMTRYLASLPERVEGDHVRIASEILTARHVSPADVPNFAKEAAREFERRKEEGYYVDRPLVVATQEKEKLRKEMETRWRTIPPYEGREFTFRGLELSKRAPDEFLQLRFNATVYNPPVNDVVSCVWWFGDRREGTVEYGPVMRRYVRGRIHTVYVPGDAVAPDGTLTVRFENVDPFGENLQNFTVFHFEEHKTLEVLFVVGGFGGNLVRTVALIFSRLLFLAAVAVLATSLFSFPIACISTLVFYGFVALRDFILDAFEFMDDPGAVGMFFKGVGLVVKVLYTIVPDWGKYNALELFADGRNVTLLWVFDGFGKLGLATLVMVGLACLLFERREVSEVSV